MPVSAPRPTIPVRTEEKKRASTTPVQQLVIEAVEAVLSKKGHDVLLIDMRGVSGVADFFLLCTADAELQTRAIVEAVQERLRQQCGERPWHIEGYEHLQWVLMDYVDLVVHVFMPERRTFYNLERLWGDAPREHIPDDGTPVRIRLLQDLSAPA
jgi:ribosome-associated protein